MSNIEQAATLLNVPTEPVRLFVRIVNNLRCSQKDIPVQETGLAAGKSRKELLDILEEEYLMKL